MKSLLFTFLILISSIVYSQDKLDKWSLNINTTSIHTDNGNYNTRNYGGGLEWKWKYDTTSTDTNFWTNTRLSFGYFANSFNKPTWYSAINKPICDKSKFEYGISLGLATGYKNDMFIFNQSYEVMPFGFIYVEYDLKYIRPRIFINPVVIGFQLNIGRK